MHRGVWAKRRISTPEIVKFQGTFGDHDGTQTPTRERRKGMKEFTLNGNVMTGVREKPIEGIQRMAKSVSSGFWTSLLNELKASFNVPFESDREKKTGLHWKEWGKL